MSEKDGGPAFPSAQEEDVFSDAEGRYVTRLTHPVGGMTLRDYFAAQILNMAAHDLWESKDIAGRAYAVADAMLLERAK